MNYLNLCKHARQECGVQGEGPSTVTGQTGLLKKFVEWVRDADLFIQTMHTDWDFLWSEFERDTVEDDDELTKPSDLGAWDRESFAVDRGTADGRRLSLTDHKVWRSNNNLKTSQPPYSITILPDNNLRLSQPADDVYTIYAAYWRAAVKLIADASEPLYPDRFHRAIVAKAKMWFFADQESAAQYREAEVEFNKWIDGLEGFALPAQYHRSQGENQMMMIVPM